MSAMAPHERQQRLRVQREQLYKAQLLATRSDQHVAQAAEHNARLARKVSRVRRQIDAVDGEYSALLSQPPGDVAGDTASAEREGSQNLQEERQQLPDELDSWLREASGKVSATQERLRSDSRREAPVHYPRVADPANIRATHSSRAQRSLGLGRRSANRSHLDKLSSNELRVMSEKELFEKLRDDAERAKAAERLARRPRWREATKARVMDDQMSPTARKGKPVPVSAEGEQPLPAAQVKKQLQHEIEYTKSLRRRPGAKQPGTRFVPRSYTGTSGAGLWAVEQYTLRPEQWWSPPDAVAERMNAVSSPIPNSEASAAADGELTQDPKIGRDKTAEIEEWLEKFERLAGKFALLAQRQREALADAMQVKADVEAKEAAEEAERILGSIKALRGRAEEAGADGDVDGAMAMMDQAKDLEAKLAAHRHEHQRKQDEYHDNAASLRNTVAEVKGTTAHLRDVEELMEFAQAIGILRDLRGMDELATVRRWRGECAMADWMELYSEWGQWEDAGKLNLAINALMPLLNGPTATRQCVPEELLPAMKKRLVVLKGHDFLKQFEPPVPRLSLPSALHDISESEMEPSGPVGAAAVDGQPNSHDESDSMGQNTHGVGEAALATLQKEYPNVAVEIPPWAIAEWSQDEARLYFETQGMIEPARKLTSEDADATDRLPNHVDNTISSVGDGATQLRQSTVAEMKARFASTLAASNNLLEELVPAKQNKAERWRIDKNKQKRVFQCSVAYSKQLKKAMQIAQGDVQKQEAAATTVEATKGKDNYGPGLLPPDKNLVGVLMRAKPQLKQLWRDVIVDESSVSINAAELGRMLSEGLNVHDFAPAALAHLMHWLGAGGILDEGWHSIPFTQFLKRLQLLADGTLVCTSGKGAAALPPVRRKQHGRSAKKVTKPLHGRRSAPPVL